MKEKCLKQREVNYKISQLLWYLSIFIISIISIYSIPYLIWSMFLFDEMYEAIVIIELIVFILVFFVSFLILLLFKKIDVDQKLIPKYVIDSNYFKHIKKIIKILNIYLLISSPFGVVWKIMDLIDYYSNLEIPSFLLSLIYCLSQSLLLPYVCLFYTLIFLLNFLKFDFKYLKMSTKQEFPSKIEENLIFKWGFNDYDEAVALNFSISKLIYTYLPIFILYVFFFWNIPFYIDNYYKYRYALVFGSISTFLLNNKKTYINNKIKELSNINFEDDKLNLIKFELTKNKKVSFFNAQIYYKDLIKFYRECRSKILKIM